MSTASKMTFKVNTGERKIHCKRVSNVRALEHARTTGRKTQCNRNTTANTVVPYEIRISYFSKLMYSFQIRCHFIEFTS